MFGPNFWLHGQRNAAMFYWSHYTRAVRIKLKNTTDLFYRLGSILVTFLVIYLWFIYKVIEYNSISPRDLQVQADLVCGAQSLVIMTPTWYFCKRCGVTVFSANTPVFLSNSRQILTFQKPLSLHMCPVMSWKHNGSIFDAALVGKWLHI